MTISSETRKAGPFPGNGVTTAFPFAFKVFTAADLAVTLNVLATGVQTLLTLTSDYTVALNPDQNANPGGTVTYNPSGVPMPSTNTLTIGSVITNTQGYQPTNGGAWLPSNAENAWDRAVILIQQSIEKVTRSLKFPIVDGALISELPPAAQRANNLLGFDASGNVVAVAPAAQSATALQALLALFSGSSLIGWIQSGAGAVIRTVQDKLREAVSLKDFGAVGDGVANDTVAITNALSYMTTYSKNVMVPPGTYLCDPFVINSQNYAGQVNFIGGDRETTIFRRRVAGAGNFVTIGSSAGTVYQSGIGFVGMTIDGGVATNGDTFVAYDMVRTTFKDCHFKGGNYALHLYGGISLSFNSCTFDFAKRGVQIEKFTSLAGGGWPNIIRFNGGEIVDNSEWGLWFDFGRMLMLRDVEVEGNGTTLAAAQGGVYIGPNVGQEVLATDTSSIGLIADGCWFEANLGTADVQLVNGINSVSNSNFFSNATMTSNDIKIDGGRYTLRNLNCSFSKTANILEGAGTLSGNVIEKIEAVNINSSGAKTSYLNGDYMIMRSGRVPSIIGMTAPMILFGADSTGVNPTITFSSPFKNATTPQIFMTVLNNGASTLDAPENYSITNTGFTMRKKTYNGTAITTANYTVNWMAIGEAP